MAASNAGLSFDPSRSNGADQIAILPFILTTGDADLRFFINVQKVARVVEGVELTPLPEDMKPFAAIYDMGGIPVPIVQSKLLVGAARDALASGSVERGQSGLRVASTTYSSSRIIICHVMNLYVGLEVPKTRKIFRVSNRELLDPPEALSACSKRMVSGIIKDQVGFLYMFDLEGFLEGIGIKFTSLQEGDSSIKKKLIGAKILIVEDSRVFMQIAQQILTKHGAVITMAKNGREALIAIDAAPTPFDLVFTDIEMPLMTGIELARIIKNSKLPIPVVFHSSISNPGLISDIKDGQLGEYLVKLDERHIIEVIERECRPKL